MCLVGVDHTLRIKNLKSLFQLHIYIEPFVNFIISKYINTIDINNNFICIDRNSFMKKFFDIYINKILT